MAAEPPCVLLHDPCGPVTILTGVHKPRRLILNWPMPKDQPWALVTFCVETAEGVPAIVQRLKHDKANMVRARPDGTKLTWQVCCFESSQAGVRMERSRFAATCSSWWPAARCLIPLLQVGAMHNFEEPSRKCKPFFINWDDPSIRPDKVKSSIRAN